MEIQTYIEIYNGIITDVKSSAYPEYLKQWENKFFKENGFNNRQDYINHLQNGHLKTEYHIIGNTLVK